MDHLVEGVDVVERLMGEEMLFEVARLAVGRHRLGRIKNAPIRATYALGSVR